MKSFKFIFALIIATLAFSQFASSVSADEVEQSQNQNFEVVCDVGAYGQNTNCRVTGSQNQYQKTHFDNVVFRNGKAIQIHKVVDTGLDSLSLALAGSIILMGGAAAAYKIFA